MPRKKHDDTAQQPEVGSVLYEEKLLADRRTANRLLREALKHLPAALQVEVAAFLETRPAYE